MTSTEYPRQCYSTEGVPDLSPLRGTVQGRSLMPRSQPPLWRAMDTAENPAISLDADVISPVRFGTAGMAWVQNHWVEKSDAVWPHQLDLSPLGDGESETMEIRSLMAFDPVDPRHHRRGMLGNYRALMHEAAGLPIDRNAHHFALSIEHIDNLMPILFKRICSAMDEHWGSLLSDEPDIPFTVGQVIGTDIEASPSPTSTSRLVNTAYCRILQPEGGTDGQARFFDQWLSSNLILAYVGVNAETKAGDVLIMPIERWTGTGFMLDAVRRSGQPSHIRLAACYGVEDDDGDGDGAEWRQFATEDAWRYATNPDTRPDAPIVPHTFIGEIHLDNESWWVHQSKDEAWRYAIASQVLAGATGIGQAAAGATLPQDAFIPAWKDKRPPKCIDRSSPRPPHYHDEIRCQTCNGRVVVMLPPQNRAVDADCPHCGTTKGLRFPHMIPATPKP